MGKIDIKDISERLRINFSPDLINRVEDLNLTLKEACDGNGNLRILREFMEENFSITPKKYRESLIEESHKNNSLTLKPKPKKEIKKLGACLERYSTRRLSSEGQGNSYLRDEP
jgi:hypothetical protein